MIAVARKSVDDVNVVVTSMYFNCYNYDRFVSVASMCHVPLIILQFYFPFKFPMLFLKIYQTLYRRKDSSLSFYRFEYL